MAGVDAPEMEAEAGSTQPVPLGDLLSSDGKMEGGGRPVTSMSKDGVGPTTQQGQWRRAKLTVTGVLVSGGGPS